MTNEDYVSYDLAMRLKQAGFDWPCRAYWMKTYIDKDIMTIREDLRASNHNEYAPDYYSAPILYEAQKWLREKKKVDVLIWNCACGYGWDVSKAGDELTRGTTLLAYDDNGEDKNSGMWPTYESALSAGIEAALNILTDNPEE